MMMTRAAMPATMRSHRSCSSGESDSSDAGGRTERRVSMSGISSLCKRMIAYPRNVGNVSAAAVTSAFEAKALPAAVLDHDISRRLCPLCLMFDLILHAIDDIWDGIEPPGIDWLATIGANAIGAAVDACQCLIDQPKLLTCVVGQAQIAFGVGHRAGVVR